MLFIEDILLTDLTPYTVTIGDLLDFSIARIDMGCMTGRALLAASG